MSYVDGYNEVPLVGDFLETPLASIEEQLNVTNIAPYSGTTVYVNPSLDVTQNLTVHGNIINVGDETITGNLTVTGTITSDAGVITNSVTAKTLGTNLVLQGNSSSVEVNSDLQVTSTSYFQGASEFASLAIFDASARIYGTLYTDTINALTSGSTTVENDLYINNTLLTPDGQNLVLTTYNPVNEIYTNRNITLQTGTALAVTSDTIKSDYIESRTLNHDVIFVGNGTGQVTMDDYLNINSGYKLQFVTQATPKKTTNILPRGASPADRDYYLPEVTSGADFVMSEGAQTINGTKTFDRALSDEFVVTLGGGLYFENSALYTTKVTAQATAANRTIIIPESTFAGTNYFIISGPDSFINGQKEFTSTTYFNNASPAIAFGTSTSALAKTFVIHSIPSANRNITIQDAGADSNFVLSEGTMTINGNKTLSGVTSFTNTTNSTSTSTGAIVCSGGAAINKNIYIGTTSGTDGAYYNNNTASYTPSVLNYNETGNFSATFTCRGGTSASQTIYFERRGKRVTLTFQNFTLTSSTSGTNPNVIIATGVVPTRLRPNTRIEPGYFSNTDTGISNSGPIHITSGGNLEIYKSATLPNWNTSATVGTSYPVALNYIIT